MNWRLLAGIYLAIWISLACFMLSEYERGEKWKPFLAAVFWPLIAVFALVGGIVSACITPKDK